ncbi:DinB family protein [Emticicia sp. C21]|uniref:DinB family protein n=1 Tax=Emticicia sp. C21 TaxID=2302915 RepID=UPI000E34341B|nr:DinB family protein [Emticicia sp. C21]RFS15540.1 DinB family protein [Emticicia sp. C21]
MTRQTSIEVINQLKDLLNQINSNEYTESLAVLNESSIGQHVRHTIEFFQCLIKGSLTGIVDYDARERNLLIETNLLFALNVLTEIEHSVATEPNLYRTLKIKVNYGENNFEFIESNFMRELVYMIEHSIHHFALIRIGIQENFRHIQIEPTFGVAYSTIKYKQEILAFEN